MTYKVNLQGQPRGSTRSVVLVTRTDGHNGRTKKSPFQTSIHTSEAVEAIFPPDVIRNLNDPLWRRLRQRGCGKPDQGWTR